MNEDERECVEGAIKNWVATKAQNWKLESPLYIHPNK